jgi:3-methyladenine DNA glycosylase AlkC
MGEPLKNQFDKSVPHAIAEQVSRAWGEFDGETFLADVLQGYDALELMDRGRAIGSALSRHLPSGYPAALEVLMRSIREPHSGHNLRGGMAAFYYMPHTAFIASNGLDHFELSMKAQHELTQLFTAEFSIRPFIEKYEQKSLDLLRTWASDPSADVRRLVSEGTRPRLPWGSRLRSFQKNPAPVIALLELLKDDDSLYVRRSVANNLNDIGKDHPDILVRTARRWMKGATAERSALVRHALRSLVKQGNADALAILGFGRSVAVVVENPSLSPRRVVAGGRVTVSFTIRNRSPRRQRILVDFRIYFVKANGSSSPKVFKLKSVELDGSEAATFRKTVTLGDLTTRKHYSGVHAVDVLVNGSAIPIGAFTLKK